MKAKFDPILGQFRESDEGSGGFTPTNAQRDAINSGITAGKVAAYDGYATGKADLVDGKVPESELPLAAVSGGKKGIIGLGNASITGLEIPYGVLRIALASNSQINDKTQQFQPIVPKNLGYAVRSVSPLIAALPANSASPIALTDASATTRNHSFTYVHAPATAPTYQLPAVTDSTIGHQIDLTVHFSSAVLSCSFQNSDGHTVTPASTPEITSSSVVNYLCEYVTDVGWAVYPLVVPTAAAPSGPGYIVSGFTAPAEANGTYTPNGTSDDGETKYSNGNGYTLFHKWSRWHIIADAYVDSSQTEDERAAVSASDSITSSHTIESGSPSAGTVTVVQA